VRPVSIPQISPAQALEAQRAGSLLVDVREQDEWDAGHAPGALHLPLGELAERRGELEGVGHVVMVCRSGARSDLAASLLASAGLEAENLAGGMQAWKRDGQSLEPADGTVI
jgi:rhodanese-related sulfurtransferase